MSLASPSGKSQLRANPLKAWPISVSRSSWRPMLACAGWYLIIVGIQFIPIVAAHNGIFMVFAIISAVAMTGVMAALGANTAGSLEVFADRIVLGARVLERHGLRGEIVSWKQAGLWTTLGSAICLEGPGGSLRVGGRDRLLVIRSSKPATQKVDASLTSHDFMDFVRALALVPDPLAGTEATDAVTVDLVPSASSTGGLRRAIGPWMATLAIAGIIGALASSFESLRTGVGLVVVQGATIVVVVGGLALTFRRSMRPPAPRYRLRIEPMRVALNEVKTASPIDAAVPKPTAAPFVFHYSTRGGSFDFPAVRLTWPSKTMVVGVWDTSLTWPPGTPRVRKLEYIVGPEEWRRLVHELGIDLIDFTSA
jgi:hypothetical protein